MRKSDCPFFGFLQQRFGGCGGKRACVRVEVLVGPGEAVGSLAHPTAGVLLAELGGKLRPMLRLRLVGRLPAFRLALFAECEERQLGRQRIGMEAFYRQVVAGKSLKVELHRMVAAQHMIGEVALNGRVAHHAVLVLAAAGDAALDERHIVRRRGDEQPVVIALLQIVVRCEVEPVLAQRSGDLAHVVDDGLVRLVEKRLRARVEHHAEAARLGGLAAVALQDLPQWELSR